MTTPIYSSEPPVSAPPADPYSDSHRDTGPASVQDLRETSLRVSLFDVVTSLFLSLILLLGCLVGVLLIIWWVDRPAMVVKLVQPVRRAVTTDNSLDGWEQDFQEPGVEEVEQLREVSVQDALLAVTEAVSRVAAAPLVADSDLSRSSEGKGPGNSRPPGPIRQEGVPAFQRWQLKFAARDLDSYARQLDFHQIELGAVGGRPGVDYAGSLSTGPRSRHGESTAEKRLYFLWNSPGPLLMYDLQLLRRAGVELSGRQVLKFISPELENRLAALELEYARANGRSSVTEIAATVFVSEKSAGGYRFRVISQRYRRPRS